MRIIIIGTGRMGMAQSRLARLFGDEILLASDSDCGALGVYSSEFSGTSVCGADELGRHAFAFARADLVWVTVCDGAIGPVSDRIAGLIRNGDAVVLHTSGALSADVLSAGIGSDRCGSLHPLASCPPPDASDESCLARYRGVMHTFEGGVAARGVASELVGRLGSRLLEIRAGTKAMYHEAAVFASNYPVALADVARGLFERCGISHEDALSISAGLLGQAAETLAEVGEPVAALTGPVKRRDIGTILSHRAASDSETLALYDALLRVTAGMVGWDMAGLLQ